MENVSANKVTGISDVSNKSSNVSVGPIRTSDSSQSHYHPDTIHNLQNRVYKWPFPIVIISADCYIGFLIQVDLSFSIDRIHQIILHINAAHMRDLHNILINTSPERRRVEIFEYLIVCPDPLFRFVAVICLQHKIVDLR